MFQPICGWKFSNERKEKKIYIKIKKRKMLNYALAVAEARIEMLFSVKGNGNESKNIARIFCILHQKRKKNKEKKI